MLLQNRAGAPEAVQLGEVVSYR
jgi:hypothetical protein